MTDYDSKDSQSAVTHNPKHFRFLSVAVAILLIAGAAFSLLGTACSKDDGIYYTDDGIAYTYELIWFDDDPYHEYPDYISFGNLAKYDYSVSRYFNLGNGINFVSTPLRNLGTYIYVDLASDSYVYMYSECIYPEHDVGIAVYSGDSTDNNVYDSEILDNYEGYFSFFLPSGYYSISSNCDYEYTTDNGGYGIGSSAGYLYFVVIVTLV